MNDKLELTVKMDTYGNIVIHFLEWNKLMAFIGDVLDVKWPLEGEQK